MTEGEAILWSWFSRKHRLQGVFIIELIGYVYVSLYIYIYMVCLYVHTIWGMYASIFVYNMVYVCINIEYSIHVCVYIYTIWYVWMCLCMYTVWYVWEIYLYMYTTWYMFVCVNICIQFIMCICLYMYTVCMCVYFFLRYWPIIS